MNDAESKYNELKRDKIWDKPSDRQVIVALKTLLDKKSSDRRKKDKKGRKKDKERKNKGNKSTRTKCRTPKHNEKDEGWVKTPPKKGEEDIIKKIDGKEWNWCKFHNKWVIVNGKWGKHTSDTCRLNPKNKKRENDTNPTVQVNAANIADNSSTTSSSSDDSTDTMDSLSE